MNNTLTIAEIKRRGMAAIDEGLKHGPVHIVKRNKLAAVVLSEDEYQRLAYGEVKAPGGVTAVQWLLGQPATGKRSKVQIDADFKETAMSDELLLKFRARSTTYGVTRKTLKALAAELDMTETMVIHLAVARFAREVLPTYEADDGPLPAGYVAWLKKSSEPRLPKGKIISKKSLF